ncbi:uncharacterized protein LOC125666891 [Ostrea edulis]|uniref:uncharacterized protein LOC125666891 n=1 Tax=Ostrea edulis TaxID=37623 RepID=UPI0024AF647A|nr:uncharacterized protein LOC125666891 [Ostrea edulis]
MSEIQRLVFFLLKLLCVMRTNANTERNQTCITNLHILELEVQHRDVPISTICLTDLLSFYDADLSCSFTEQKFFWNFEDNGKACLVTCTLKEFTPDLKDGTTYELEKLEIKFSNTYFTFPMMKLCGDHGNTDVEITMTCDERGFYERRIGESCTHQSQCNVSNPYSTCNPTNGVCECKSGYFKIFNTCFQEKRIGESCTNQSLCDVSNPYSTCNTSNGVWECKEGYFEMFNTCFQEHLSMGETCELNEQCMGNTGIGFCRQTEGGKVCSLFPETDDVHSSQHGEITRTKSSSEVARNNDLPVGMIAGAAAAGFVLGIIFCGIFCVMLSRCKKSTSEKRSVEFAATVDNYGFNVVAISTGKTEQKTVQVSEERSQKHVDGKGQTSPPDDIYNHLNEASGMSDIQPEYDHVPSNDTNGETYHRLDLNITRNANTTPLVDMENHYD